MLILVNHAAWGVSADQVVEMSIAPATLASFEAGTLDLKILTNYDDPERILEFSAFLTKTPAVIKGLKNLNRRLCPVCHLAIMRPVGKNPKKLFEVFIHDKWVCPNCNFTLILDLREKKVVKIKSKLPSPP